MTKAEIIYELKIYAKEAEVLAEKFDDGEFNRIKHEYYIGKCMAYEKALDMISKMGD